MEFVAAKNAGKTEFSAIPSHLERFEFILNCGIGADVTFLMGERKKPVKAHRFILKTMSPVFQKLLDGNADNAFIDLPKLEIGEFKLLLKYLYVGRIMVATEEALPLMKAAKHFNIPELAQFCKELLEIGLTKDAALTIFQQARKFNDNKRAEEALKIICGFGSEIIQSDQFTDLSTADMAMILKQDDLRVPDEIGLFESLVGWGRAECRRLQLEPSPKYLRSVLENLLPLIRFPLMTPNDFSLRVATTQILSSEELIYMLLYFNVDADRLSAMSTGKFSSKPRAMENFAEEQAEIRHPNPNGPLYGDGDEDPFYFMGR